VPNHVDLIHSEHPQAEAPATQPGKFRAISVDQFENGEWITLAAAGSPDGAVGEDVTPL
jgi:hypothetical protein